MSVTVQHSVTPDCHSDFRISFCHHNVTDYGIQKIVKKKTTESINFFPSAMKVCKLP
jgi:hypothetical protein